MEPLKAVRAGSESGFLTMFDEHHLPLFRFAYRMTGSVADAEEIVQDCFLALLQPGCRFDGSRTPLRTYLFGAVRNQALKRLRLREQNDGRDVRAELDSPETGLLRAELEDAVSRAVRGLPESQREVLILAHYEQLSLAEIAAALGIEVAAVKSRLQRARASLRETLAAYAPGAERKQ